MKKLKITASIISAAIIVISNMSLVSAHEIPEEHNQKDYTQAPYYYALEEWFDFNGYTAEQRESFMADTETLDWILYNDDYWNYGNYQFTLPEETENGIAPHNAPNYPISGYESGTYFSDSGNACTHHNSGCSIYGGCGCRCVNNSIQCMGFANFFRWVRTGEYLTSSTKISGLTDWTKNNILNYFNNNLNVGSHVRLHVKNKSYFHSITVVKNFGTGITVYDCNLDGKCGIKIYNLSWNDIYNNYDYINYSNTF